MGILQRFKERSNKTAKTSNLQGGVHKNVIFVDFKEDLEKKGDLNRYLFMKFKKLDEEGNPEGEFSNSFIELDVTSNYLEFKVKLLLTQTANLAEAMFGAKWEEKYDPLYGIIEEDEYHYTKVHAKLEKRAFVRELEKHVKEGVGKFINEFFETDADKKFILKLIYNDKGYVNLPSGMFIQAQSDKKFKLQLSDKEKSLIKKFRKEN